MHSLSFFVVAAKDFSFATEFFCVSLRDLREIFRYSPAETADLR